MPWCYNLMQGYLVTHTIIIILLLTTKWVHVHVCTLDSMYYCFADHHRLSSFQLVWLSSYPKIHQVSPRVQSSTSSSWLMPSLKFLRFTASTSFDHPLSENFSSSLNIRKIMVTTCILTITTLVRFRGLEVGHNFHRMCITLNGVYKCKPNLTSLSRGPRSCQCIHNHEPYSCRQRLCLPCAARDSIINVDASNLGQYDKEEHPKVKPHTSFPPHPPP